jgi:hypothetical protein
MQKYVLLLLILIPTITYSSYEISEKTKDELLFAVKKELNAIINNLSDVDKQVFLKRILLTDEEIQKLSSKKNQIQNSWPALYCYLPNFFNLSCSCIALLFVSNPDMWYNKKTAIEAGVSYLIGSTISYINSVSSSAECITKLGDEIIDHKKKIQEELEKHPSLNVPLIQLAALCNRCPEACNSNEFHQRILKSLLNAYKND